MTQKDRNVKLEDLEWIQENLSKVEDNLTTLTDDIYEIRMFIEGEFQNGTK